ncbi:uncharacterized protein LOC109535731 isoform X1 [Dendroctonus ponderosae]|uniref:Uncharacterized protein n=1 Tax=Dendroctonus ponderosae TaxID=77166 RepID=A0AAR5P823_DENPD|nr:uncharacterized protein LOC109535731 isoform X1 [Dendroctonus ponderosae]KAH1024217.1 hypothetical protein HUJ05_003740 [Dendroctonus ponderosae]
MFELVRIFGICLYFAFAFSQGDDFPITVNLTDDSPTFTWTANDYPSIIVGAENGYQIQVNVTVLNLDGENGDYITIQSSKEDEISDAALMFTYTVNDQPCYLFNYSEIRADFIGATNEINTFEIKFIRVGEAITTTPEPLPTTTTPAMPTAAPDEHANLTVYLYGRAAADYKFTQILSLKQAIVSMGTEYCRDQNCPLNESITTNNVKIDLLESCPIYWENFDNCILLTFALPIIKKENASELWAGYQLDKENLRYMWNNYAESYIMEIGLELYNVPNVIHIYTYRLIVICVVVVLLVILILGLRTIIARINKRKRRSSDVASFMDQSSNRPSQLSLTPHYLQIVPALFTTDFPMYPEQRNDKQYADFQENSVSEEIEPIASPELSVLSMAPDESNEPEHAEE